MINIIVILLTIAVIYLGIALDKMTKKRNICAKEAVQGLRWGIEGYEAANTPLLRAVIVMNLEPDAKGGKTDLITWTVKGFKRNDITHPGLSSKLNIATAKLASIKCFTQKEAIEATKEIMINCLIEVESSKEVQTIKLN